MSQAEKMRPSSSAPERTQPVRRPAFHATKRAEYIADQLKRSAKRKRHGFEQIP
jgi:hypothetical protein